jgi:hypothetical protein
VEYEDGLNTAIRKLRETLSDQRDKPKFIETVPRRGYRFIAPVEEVMETPHAGLEGEPSEAEPPPAAPATAPPSDPGEERKAPDWTVAALVLVIAIAAVSYFAWRHFRAAGPKPITGSAMLAVLPFENLTGDAGEEYVSDGFTEEIISQLGRLNHDQLRVIARTSMMTYKGSRKPIKEIAQELGVNYVLEGSIRKTGDGLRVTRN